MSCFTLQENTNGSRYLCASVTLDMNGDQLTKGVAHAVYDKCRAGSLDMPGFPNFDVLLNALRAGAASVPPREYHVCAPVACPQIVILSVWAWKLSHGSWIPSWYPFTFGGVALIQTMTTTIIDTTIHIRITAYWIWCFVCSFIVPTGWWWQTCNLTSLCPEVSRWWCHQRRCPAMHWTTQCPFQWRWRFLESRWYQDSFVFTKSVSYNQAALTWCSLPRVHLDPFSCIYHPFLNHKS